MMVRELSKYIPAKKQHPQFQLTLTFKKGKEEKQINCSVFMCVCIEEEPIAAEINRLRCEIEQCTKTIEHNKHENYFLKEKQDKLSRTLRFRMQEQAEDRGTWVSVHSCLFQNILDIDSNWEYVSNTSDDCHGDFDECSKDAGYVFESLCDRLSINICFNHFDSRGDYTDDLVYRAMDKDFKDLHNFRKDMRRNPDFKMSDYDNCVELDLFRLGFSGKPCKADCGCALY